MSIEFEDRTNETLEEEFQRRVGEVGQILVATTVQASEFNPAIGLSALALVLGQGAARTGASLDQVLAAVTYHFHQAKSDPDEPASDDDEDDELPDA
jgi:hypothetical protein